MLSGLARRCRGLHSSAVQGLLDPLRRDLRLVHVLQGPRGSGGGGSLRVVQGAEHQDNGPAAHEVAHPAQGLGGRAIRQREVEEDEVSGLRPVPLQPVHDALHVHDLRHPAPEAAYVPP